MKHKFKLRFASLIIVTTLMVLTSIPAGASSTFSRSAQPPLFTISTTALLSNNIVSGGNPITYSVDFHTPFASISEVEYYFVFGSDPLDQWENLMYTGEFPGGLGFLNPYVTPQTYRIQTFPCSVHPQVCDDFMDGYSQGEISIEQFTGDHIPSVNIAYLVVYIDGTQTIDVTIDVKPEASNNPINLKSGGTIPVAILSTPDFDATTMINESSLTFGKSGREQSLAFCNDGAEDVNGDGLPDQICHFYTQLTNLNYHITSVYLRGKTVNGVKLEGRDSITIVNY